MQIITVTDSDGSLIKNTQMYVRIPTTQPEELLPPKNVDIFYRIRTDNDGRFQLTQKASKQECILIKSKYEIGTFSSQLHNHITINPIPHVDIDYPKLEKIYKESNQSPDHCIRNNSSTGQEEKNISPQYQHFSW